jgi:hypothetical protein
MGLACLPNSRCLDLVVNKVQSNVSLVCLPHSECLDFTTNNVGLAYLPDPKCLDLTDCQIQTNIGQACSPDPRCLDLAVSQVQSSWTWQLAKSVSRGSRMFTRPKMSGLGELSSTKYMDLTVSEV